MLIFRRLITLFLLSVMSFSTFAATDINVQQSIQQISQLQQKIDNDIYQLKNAKGELAALIEYRINTHGNDLRNEIANLVNNHKINNDQIKAIVRHQLKFVQQVNGYLAKTITSLEQKMNATNNNSLILQIAKRQLDQNQYLMAQLQAINWAQKLGINTTKDKRLLTQTLINRGDRTQSLINFIQKQLKTATNEAHQAGKDVTPAQKEKVSFLKDWLQQTNISLANVIDMLDSLGQNTASLKKTQFSVSGDITQDVLNVDVASSLIQQWVSAAKSQAIDNGPTITFKLFIFIIILLVTGLISRIVQRIVNHAVSNSKLNFSKLLQDFFSKLSTKLVYTIGLLVALSQLGIELAPLLAGFGIAGVIIGFALQDTLSNFASGMMILIYRPYDVGDLINAAGVTGKVSHMSLVSTTILTLDNQRLIVPNNKIWGDTINNITVEHQRRVDMVFGISYSDDIAHAEKVLNDIVMSHPKVLNSPEPTIKLHTLNSSSVDFVVRPWATPDDYWDVYWDITREVKIRFDKEGISIPFPQQDVHIYQKTA